eukprot:10418871-Alexandrium_andersonii.AAC.1
MGGGARSFVDQNHYGGRQHCAGRFEERPRPSCRVDLYAAGPPCQSFSQAGKRKGLADERGLYFGKAVDEILAIQPATSLLENVVGIQRVAGGQYARGILSKLREGG